MNICTKNNDIINIILEDNTIQYYIFIDIVMKELGCSNYQLYPSIDECISKWKK